MRAMLNACCDDARARRAPAAPGNRDFNTAYAAALDEQRLTDWAEMFTDDAFYVVISRENVDRGHAGRPDLLR